MKMSSLARRQHAAREASKAATSSTAQMTAAIYRAGMSELLGAEDGEDLRSALNRVIDTRIAERRWYRRLWRSAAHAIAAWRTA